MRRYLDAFVFKMYKETQLGETGLPMKRTQDEAESPRVGCPQASPLQHMSAFQRPTSTPKPAPQLAQRRRSPSAFSRPSFAARGAEGSARRRAIPDPAEYFVEAESNLRDLIVEYAALEELPSSEADLGQNRSTEGRARGPATAQEAFAACVSRGCDRRSRQKAYSDFCPEDEAHQNGGNAQCSRLRYSTFEVAELWTFQAQSTASIARGDSTFSPRTSRQRTRAADAGASSAEESASSLLSASSESDASLSEAPKYDAKLAGGEPRETHSDLPAAGDGGGVNRGRQPAESIHHTSGRRDERGAKELSGRGRDRQKTKRRKLPELVLVETPCGEPYATVVLVPLCMTCLASSSSSARSSPEFSPQLATTLIFRMAFAYLSQQDIRRAHERERGDAKTPSLAKAAAGQREATGGAEKWRERDQEGGEKDAPAATTSTGGRVEKQAILFCLQDQLCDYPPLERFIPPSLNEKREELESHTVRQESPSSRSATSPSPPDGAPQPSSPALFCADSDCTPRLLASAVSSAFSSSHTTPVPGASPGTADCGLARGAWRRRPTPARRSALSSWGTSDGKEMRGRSSGLSCFFQEADGSLSSAGLRVLSRLHVKYFSSTDSYLPRSAAALPGAYVASVSSLKASHGVSSFGRHPKQQAGLAPLLSLLCYLPLLDATSRPSCFFLLSPSSALASSAERASRLSLIPRPLPSGLYTRGSLPNPCRPLACASSACVASVDSSARLHSLDKAVGALASTPVALWAWLLSLLLTVAASPFPGLSVASPQANETRASAARSEAAETLKRALVFVFEFLPTSCCTACCAGRRRSAERDGREARGDRGGGDTAPRTRETAERANGVQAAQAMRTRAESKRQASDDCGAFLCGVEESQFIRVCRERFSRVVMLLPPPAGSPPFSAAETGARNSSEARRAEDRGKSKDRRSACVGMRSAATRARADGVEERETAAESEAARRNDDECEDAERAWITWIERYGRAAELTNPGMRSAF
ncbi:hypothetical protein BESB_007390 [Besnoitia besnoiti]|uniref:Uncharacterized protein n=1 Tax=Besnoitia besnoiti TaxID=94643 RepID=A0A2A9MQC4_BESBE|nr:hypothetical protein BESB_007390 [Besnoitia besnoiti]PFH38397.1 hypothetical protein BESB_007390 [Besnoitia besnoiti]